MAAQEIGVEKIKTMGDFCMVACGMPGPVANHAERMARMESGGMPDSIQVTRRVYETLKDEFVFESRGEIEVKGKGRVEAWLLRV